MLPKDGYLAKKMSTVGIAPREHSIHRGAERPTPIKHARRRRERKELRLKPAQKPLIDSSNLLRRAYCRNLLRLSRQHKGSETSAPHNTHTTVANMEYGDFFK